MMAITDDKLLLIASLFYEGILSPSGWQQGLEKLAIMTKSDAASLILWNRRVDNAIVGEQFGLPDQLQKEYAEHFYALDHGSEFCGQMPLGEWYMDERHLGSLRMQNSPFYQDFLRCYELDSTMTTPILRGASGTDGFLSLSGRPGKRNMADVARELAPLLPHLQRAAQLRTKLFDMSRQLELSVNALDHFKFPLLVVTADKRVMLSNKLGEQWLAQPGSPMSCGSSHAARVSALLKDACGYAGPRKASGVQIKKSDGANYYLTALPLSVEATSAWHNSTPMALIWVNDPSLDKPAAGELLKQMFHLSAAEIRLTQSLLSGTSLQDSANQLGISIDTGRTHLKSIFAKLGIRKQTELQRILGGINIINS
jgi:DNA-binding CsgD family transcriptional regulator